MGEPVCRLLMWYRGEVGVGVEIGMGATWVEAGINSKVPCLQYVKSTWHGAKPLSYDLCHTKNT